MSDNFSLIIKNGSCYIEGKFQNIDIALSGKENVDVWCENLKGEIFGKNNIRLKNDYGKIDDLTGYDQGAWWIQDIAAQLPSKILLSSVKKNACVIDICAAPGGKTAQLLRFYKDKIAKVRIEILSDPSKQMKIVTQSMNEINFNDSVIKLIHGKGETDDATYLYSEKEDAIFTGDFFIWSLPNAGNPSKAQRYVGSWGGVLKDMSQYLSLIHI